MWEELGKDDTTGEKKKIKIKEVWGNQRDIEVMKKSLVCEGEVNSGKSYRTDQMADKGTSSL